MIDYKFWRDLPHYKCSVCGAFIQVLDKSRRDAPIVDKAKTTEFYKKHLTKHKEEQK